MSPRLKLGQLLLESGVITPAQLAAALADQQKRGGKIGDTLVRTGALSERLLVETLARQLELPFVHLEEIASVGPGVLERVPLSLARQVLSLPVEWGEGNRALVVAMVEPQHLRHLELLRAAAGVRIVPRLAGRTAMLQAISRLYPENRAALG